MIINTRLIIISTLFSIILISCKKNHIDIPTQEMKPNELRFFGLNENTNSNIKQISEYLKKLNQKKPFVNKFIKLAGYPRWDKGFLIPKDAINQLTQPETIVADSTYIIPVVSETDRFVTGAIIASIEDSTAYRLVLLKDYQSYNDEDAKAMFIKAIMVLDAKVYGYNKFKINDTIAITTKEVYFSQRGTSGRSGKRNALESLSPCDIIEIWYNPDGDACNCNGDEYYTGEWYYEDAENCNNSPAPVLIFIGGSGGGGTSWPPNYYTLPDLPLSGGGTCGGGSGNPPYSPIPTTELQKMEYLIEQLNLNLNEEFYLSIHDGALNTIFNYVHSSNTVNRRNLAKWVINFIPNNQDIPFSTLDNWYFKQPEYKGGEIVIDPSQITYDQVVQQTPLPSLNSFETNFPKLGSSGSYTQMPSPSVYHVVGGSLAQSHINNPDQYSNACAIRGSRGLLYSGITIPVLNYNGSQRTQKGGDDKNYILDAVSFNKFMIDKFGDTPNKLTQADANDPQKLANLLKGKNGIYVIINNDPSSNGAGYSGHVDLILNGSCIGGAYTTPTGGVKSIRVWILN